MATQQSKRIRSTFIALSPIVLLTGIIGLAGTRAPVTAADTDGPVATATRRAELTELAELRTEVAVLKTQVAQIPPTPTATATPSPTPTPTLVPPAPLNQALPYQDDWTVTVIAVTKTTTVTGYNQSATAEGVYIVVNLTATNNTRDGQRFPFRDLILVDDRGRVFELALYESIMVSGNWSAAFPPSIPTDTAIVFDVTPDIGDRFILESRTDPTFRVQLEVVLRG
jgi:hypothetical protein